MNLFGIEHSVFVIVFLLLFGKFCCVFCLCLKFIWCVCQKLILKNVGDENYLHRVYEMVDYNILVLL